MYLYILSSESILALKSVYKIGCTESLPERLSTFLTGRPPNFEPSHELEFVAAATNFNRLLCNTILVPIYHMFYSLLDYKFNNQYAKWSQKDKCKPFPQI